MISAMKNPQEALKILRRAGEKHDGQIDIAETAIALASLEKAGADMTSYQAHLDLLAAQVHPDRNLDLLEDQLRVLRQLLVVEHKYHGDENHAEDCRNSNLMDVIDRRCGAPVPLGLLYLHVAQAAGWAMTGIDLSGHFLLRLSARDGQVLIDPFRAGQTCHVQEIEEDYYGEDGLLEEMDFIREDETFDLTSSLARPLTPREVLLQLQHDVKRRMLSQDRVEPAISILQSMLLFAPQQEDLWREIGYLQAERGHIRAAITALEVVCDLAPEHMPPEQNSGILKDLRMRLN